MMSGVYATLQTRWNIVAQIILRHTNLKESYKNIYKNTVIRSGIRDALGSLNTKLLYNELPINGSDIKSNLIKE